MLLLTALVGLGDVDKLLRHLMQCYMGWGAHQSNICLLLPVQVTTGD